MKYKKWCLINCMLICWSTSVVGAEKKKKTFEQVVNEEKALKCFSSSMQKISPSSSTTTYRPLESRLKNLTVATTTNNDLLRFKSRGRSGPRGSRRDSLGLPEKKN